MPHEQCTRKDWHQKALRDLVDEGSGYNHQIAPSTVPMPGMRAPGHHGSTHGPPRCQCAADDERCENTTGDGKECLVCRSRDRCSQDVVSFAIHLFKLHTIDLKTSLLAFSAWVREAWSDPRLRFNVQCYGGLDYFEATAQSGSLGNSRLWTPDLEIYNGEDSIWSGSIQAHLAIVYPCTPDGKPSHGMCGGVFWSRPAILRMLCKYEGLVKFPFDTLRCKMEVAAFGLAGHHQDIILRESDGGVSWTGMDVKDGFVGLTAGSAFQDYIMRGFEAERYVVSYAGWDFPTLIYKMTFERATVYYVFRLVLPVVVLTVLSFIQFWMSPEIGERLGFGITLILAMVANDVVAADMMPVANEKLLMDYASFGCQLFGNFSLVETGFVLFLYHHSAEDLAGALLPTCIRKLFGALAALFRSQQSASDDSKEELKSWVVVDPVDKGSGQQLKWTIQGFIHGKDPEYSKAVNIRCQLYRQVFYTVDEDFSGHLDLDEVSGFCRFVLGGSWDERQTQLLFDKLDTDDDNYLDFDEFVVFCELGLPFKDDHDFTKGLIEGFLAVHERMELARQRMWQDRAASIDQFCRWTVPPGFVLFLVVLFSLSEEQLSRLLHNEAAQVALIICGMLPVTLAVAVVGLLGLRAAWLRRRKSERRSRICPGDPGDSVGPA